MAASASRTWRAIAPATAVIVGGLLALPAACSGPGFSAGSSTDPQVTATPSALDTTVEPPSPVPPSPEPPPPEEPPVPDTPPAPTGSAVSPGPGPEEVPTTPPPPMPPPLSACGPLRLEADAGAHGAEVCLPGGLFNMGADAPNLGSGFADHTPAHPVELSPFVLDAFEVTVERYTACVTDQACPSPRTGPGCTYAPDEPATSDLPVTCVTWDQAAQFCAWDGGRRLPTEAEWEFAARSGEERFYPWGDEFDCAKAVLGAGTTCRSLSALGPLAVGSAPLGATVHGIFDMTGNAPEWTADWLGSYPSELSTDPKGPKSGANRVLRGGSWRNQVESGFTYARSPADPKSTGNWGFRCARDATAVATTSP